MGNRDYDLLYKLLLIGDSNVEKGKILSRFCNENLNTVKCTIGVDFVIKTITVKGKQIKLQIWDTAGQERHKTVTSAYYRGARGIMLVYDITNLKSFENIPSWIQNIEKHFNHDVPTVLVGNNCEMEDDRQVSKEQGHAFAMEHNLKFVEASANMGINIDHVFHELVESILVNRGDDGDIVNLESSNENTVRRKSQCF